MQKRKTAAQLRSRAANHAKERYGIDATKEDILAIEKQIRKGKSLWIGSMSSYYTGHLVHLKGKIMITIYDKRRGCVDCIMPRQVIDSWMERKKVNKDIFESWKLSWQT